GVGQAARRRQGDTDALVALLDDPSAEIRSQAAKVLGDARCRKATDRLAELLQDESPRVRLHAGIALSKVDASRHVSKIVGMLEKNAGKDRFLRHAGVMALARVAQDGPAAIEKLRSHPSAEVRLASVVALRRVKSPGVAIFLADMEPRVATEAARAIHDDLSIMDALPALAGALTRRDAQEALQRRSLSAKLRVGDSASALRIARFAARDDVSDALRAHALQTLAAWLKPPALDQVQGTHRGLPPRQQAAAHAALDATLGQLFAAKSKTVQVELSRVIKELKYDNAEKRVTELALDAKQPVALRVSALAAMSALNASELERALASAASSDHPLLRIAALEILCDRKPAEQATAVALNKAIASESLRERQFAARVLGTTKSAQARRLLDELFAKLVAGTAADEMQLDVYQAARSDERLAGAVSKLDAELTATPLRQFQYALAGGDPERGEAIFRDSPRAQCIRCHRIGGDQQTVGPDLAKIASRKPADYLLRSVVLPNAEI
ncbi:MAG: HEAT repeat domain-containing protein, partial [Planctomycetales bacterium]